MYNYHIHQQVHNVLQKHSIDKQKHDAFYARLLANTPAIDVLYKEIYGGQLNSAAEFDALMNTIVNAYIIRPGKLKEKDTKKLQQNGWFLSNQLTGMSLYVDRFSGDIKTLDTKLGYFENLGVNVLHLMPLFESPEGESDGGYAVSNFRKIDSRFGTLHHLEALQHHMEDEEMYLMIDIVLNHTSHQHEWAAKARAGDEHFQDYYYTYNDRTIPDEFDKAMPEVFPESSPGNFTWIPEMNKWVMTVFHDYQWDLNYSNPSVFIAMLDNILFYANLGVDILRIDAPAFIWKQAGTTCQNLPQAHALLRLIKQCVQVAAPGMALLGEAIVAPTAIMHYFGTGMFKAKECDFAYNATQMALQWDALATGNVKTMMNAQSILLQKPVGTSWITYTRCHDDIGLGYDDYMIEQAGYNAYEHRRFLKNYYSGNHASSDASGALFSFNPKTGDARISGTLASLCGLERAVFHNNEKAIDTSVRKILLMQAMSFFIGGLPMLFYGDEAGYTNDYSYLDDEGKSYDNRWMHRPIIDWNKNKKIDKEKTVEHRVFASTKNLINLRKKFEVFADHGNLTWMMPHNIHVAGFLRSGTEQQIFCVFNFSNTKAHLTWYAFKEKMPAVMELRDHWNNRDYTVGEDHEYLVIEPYSFCIIEVMK